jgi:hypothetical protein
MNTLNPALFLQEIGKERYYFIESLLKKTNYSQLLLERRGWGITRRSLYIESILLNIPQSPFIFLEKQYGVLEIIDGFKRLKALITYHNNKYPLTGLKVLKELEGEEV